jgi:Flp pilus assembly CpaF family ATPase
VLTANVGLPHASTREAIAFAIHIVAHIARDAGRRRVTQLVAVTGYDARSDTFRLETLYGSAAATYSPSTVPSLPAG